MVFCDTHCQYYNVVVVFSGRSYTVYCLGYLVTTKHHLYNISLRYVMVIAGILYIVGLGLFEAIAIQFGLDQLLEAPTHQLVSFIHWYYWSQNIGSFVIYNIAAVLGLFTNGKCNDIILKLHMENIFCPALFFSVAIAIYSLPLLLL